jgi:hypothetical protein
VTVLNQTEAITHSAANRRGKMERDVISSRLTHGLSDEVLGVVTGSGAWDAIMLVVQSGTDASRHEGGTSYAALRNGAFVRDLQSR